MTATINASTTAGVVTTADTSGILQLQTNGTAALTVDASQRTAFVAGTAALPAITTTGDTNTGIFFPAVDTIAFAEGGVESMRIDSAGDVGIGTTSPSYKLHVVNAAGGDTIVLDNGGGAGDGASTYLAFSGTNTGANFVRGRIRGAFPDATGGGLAFETGTSGSMSERMRIDSSGRLLVNTTSSTGATIAAKALSGAVALTAQSENGSSAILVSNTSGTANYNAMVIYNNTTFGTIVGSINCSGSTTNYNTSSDYRLKENIAPMTGALAKVTALKPVTYTWKIDGSDGQGFIAHELAEIVPNCVSGEKDAIETYTDENGNEQTRIKPQGIDTSFLVATLTAAIQEQQALITALTTRITALGAEIAALKGATA